MDPKCNKKCYMIVTFLKVLSVQNVTNCPKCNNCYIVTFLVATMVFPDFDFFLRKKTENVCCDRIDFIICTGGEVFDRLVGVGLACTNVKKKEIFIIVSSNGCHPLLLLSLMVYY